MFGLRARNLGVLLCMLLRPTSPAFAESDGIGQCLTSSDQQDEGGHELDEAKFVEPDLCPLDKAKREDAAELMAAKEERRREAEEKQLSYNLELEKVGYQFDIDRTKLILQLEEFEKALKEQESYLEELSPEDRELYYGELKRKYVDQE